MARLEQCPNDILLQLEPQDRILEAGRQSKDDPPPLGIVPMPDFTRLVIANRDQIEVGRRQLRIEVIGPQEVRLTNINDHNHLSLESGQDLHPGASFDSRLPMRLSRGSVQLRIENLRGERRGLPERDDVFQSFAVTPQTKVTVKDRVLATAFSRDPELDSLVGSIQSSNIGVMLDRLEQLVLVLQQVASTTDFAKQIAQTAKDMVNLDRAAVLVRQGEVWKVSALTDQQRGEQASSWQPSQTLMNQLLRDKRTLWGRPEAMTANPSESIAVLMAMVAAPILDPDGEVIGAVYGERRIGGGTKRPPIDHIDAKLVEIMACGVAGGWARVENEQTAVARRIQLERFVTKEVARTLEEDTDALAGRDTEVTMLFCDINGFSRISGQMSPTGTFDWINRVMEALTTCVVATKGTLVDYVGDELIAMWGAPLPVEDHAVAAAKTAVLMLEALKVLNETYPLPGGALTQVGIGLNSGQVRVGNTGTAHKLKYGPLGSEVNIASRVQGATRYLRTPALITGATATQLNGSFATRRLCSVRLKNIENPVELFELVANPGPKWNQFASDYENALIAWEKHDLSRAIELLSQLIAEYKTDGPTMVLLSRAVDAWSNAQDDYDAVWTLPSK
jgi:adenylate cyclase